MAQNSVDPIVLIHGYPLDGAMWDHQVRALHKAGFKAIAPDLPGFGGAAPFPTDHSAIEDYANEIHAVIGERCGGRAVVGGLSMGGYILMALLREHPESVRAAMFLDTRPEADSPETRAARLQSIEQVKSAGVAAICQPMLDRLLSKHATPAIRQQVYAILSRQSPAGVIAALHAMTRRRDSADLLASLKIPTLIVVGDHDTMTPPSVAISMQNHMPHAMLVQIADAGHLAVLEQPEAATQAMLMFLATL